MWPQPHLCRSCARESFHCCPAAPWVALSPFPAPWAVLAGSATLWMCFKQQNTINACPRGFPSPVPPQPCSLPSHSRQLRDGGWELSGRCSCPRVIEQMVLLWSCGLSAELQALPSARHPAPELSSARQGAERLQPKPKGQMEAKVLGDYFLFSSVFLFYQQMLVCQ